MLKMLRLIATGVLLFCVGGTTYAITGIVGTQFNLTQIAGTAISLGQKAMSASFPVVIASDQGNLGTNQVQIGGVTVSVGAGNSDTGTQRVVLASNQAAVAVTMTPFTTGSISGGLGVPTRTRVTCTTSSGQVVAGNANRVGMECDTDIGNTDRIHVAWGAAAATTSDKRLELGASWQPPVVSTVAVQCLAASGSQVINCTEYFK